MVCDGCFPLADILSALQDSRSSTLSLNPQHKNQLQNLGRGPGRLVANDEKQSAKKREAAKIADDIGQPKEIS